MRPDCEPATTPDRPCGALASRAARPSLVAIPTAHNASHDHILPRQQHSSEKGGDDEKERPDLSSESAIHIVSCGRGEVDGGGDPSAEGGADAHTDIERKEEEALWRVELEPNQPKPHALES